MRAALISIELFALYILENTPQLSPEAGGVKPLFLVAAALSLTSDEVAAATIYGAVCGVLTDLESGAVGFFAVTLTVLALYIGLRIRYNKAREQYFEDRRQAEIRRRERRKKKEEEKQREGWDL